MLTLDLTQPYLRPNPKPNTNLNSSLVTLINCDLQQPLKTITSDVFFTAKPQVFEVETAQNSDRRLY